MTTLLYTLAFLNVFYVLYVLVMGIYRAHLRRRMHWYHWALLWWAVALGLLADVVANLTVACVVFRDRPRELLVTSRLKRYRVSGTPRQQNLAAFICDNLLDLFDPNDNHC